MRPADFGLMNSQLNTLARRYQATVHKHLIVAMLDSSSRLGRITAHPIGVSLCLALGYMVLCSAYIVFSSRIAARATHPYEVELLKGLAFVAITGVAFFGFATFLLKRIAIQQQHLALIFHGVSDCLFLLQVEAGDCYRFLCVNAAFLKVSGLTREQVVGKRIEEVLPETSHDRVRSRFQEAIREHKSVSWEGSAAYPAGPRIGEVTLTPLANTTGTIVQLAGVVHDITVRKQAEQEVRQLSGRLLQAQDEERRRIGRELHDSTAQELVAVSLNLGLVQQRSTGRDVTSDELVADSQAIIEQSQRELRTLAYELHPPLLDDLGLVGAVQEYVEGFAQRSGIQVKLNTSPSVGRLPSNTERVLFRVIQGSLSNVLRHSGSPTATIQIASVAAEIVMEITDQGHGFRLQGDDTTAHAGVGLAGMRERVRQLGGRLEIESSDQGTTVRAIVPRQAEDV